MKKEDLERVCAAERYFDVRRGVELRYVEPTIRNLKGYFGISQGTASGYLQRMHAEGVVAQRGRRYVVVQRRAS